MENGGPNVGQLHGGGISKQTGGQCLTGSLLPGSTNPGVSRGNGHHPQSKIYSGQEKCLGGPSEQEGTDNQHRMVPPSRSSRWPDKEVGLSLDRPLCHRMEQEAASVLLPTPRPAGSGRGCPPAGLEEPGRLCLPAFPPPPEDLSEDSLLTEPTSNLSCSLMAGSPMVPRSARSPVGGPGKPTRQSGSSLPTQQRTPTPKSVSPPLTRVQTVIKILLGRGFSRQLAEDMANPVKPSSGRLYQGKWRLFQDWCQDKGIAPDEATIPQLACFFHHLRKDKQLSISAVEGYRAALNKVFSLKGMDLAASPEILLLFKHFRKTCPPRELRTPHWDVALVLKSLRGPPYEPLHSASLKNLTLKTLFLLALASSKRVSELHALSYEVSHTRRWREMGFSFVPGFVAKTQDPSKPDEMFSSFTIPSLGDFTGFDKEELILCPVRAMKAYLKRTRQFRPAIKWLFVATGKHPKEVAKNTISFWIRQVIRRAYENKEVPMPKVRAHEVRGIGSSMLFRKNLSVSQVLRAGTWKTKTTFTSSYLQEVTFKSLEVFSLGPIVAAQEIL
ncbi:uncharacterized protein LOC135213276 [Macrobrachium nipponense]|uniref:uncharacterized protein LOC135213276 n=1 Tax=Macrobrachium nipponense TaxID=159736 RepID=UPI0030C8A723